MSSSRAEELKLLEIGDTLGKNMINHLKGNLRYVAYLKIRDRIYDTLEPLYKAKRWKEIALGINEVNAKIYAHAHEFVGVLLDPRISDDDKSGMTSAFLRRFMSELNEKYPESFGDENELIYHLKQAAKDGNSDAMLELAKFYSSSRIKEDRENSVFWLIWAEKEGNLQASAIMNRAQTEIKNEKASVKEDFVKKVYTPEEIQEWINLGYENLRNGDDKSAFYYFKKAADEGNVEGMYRLGRSYLFGRGVSKDKYEASKWFEKVLPHYLREAESGNVVSMYRLGFIYMEITGDKHDVSAGLKWLNKATELGNSDAMYWLGIIYRYGDSGDKDPKKALNYFVMAVGSGHGKSALDAVNELISYNDVETMKKIAGFYEKGQGVEQDYLKAIEWYERASRANDSEAMNKIGRFYEQGIGVEKNYDKAIEWYEKASFAGCAFSDYLIGNVLLKNPSQDNIRKALEYFESAVKKEGISDALRVMEDLARNGNIDAIKRVGILYASGKGVSKNRETAIDWLSKAAELKDSQAMYLIGAIYEEVDNLGKAFEWYLKAANANFLDATYVVATMYKEGRGTKKNDKQALKWYLKAANANFLDATYVVATMYEEGRGTKKDINQAFKWYLRAAQDDDSNAIPKVAVMYEEGRGTKKDIKQAFKWYLEAAQNDDSYAISKVAVMYEEGRGTTKDDQQAFKWYLKAAQNDDSYAIPKVAVMYEEGRGTIKDDQQAFKWYLRLAQSGDNGAMFKIAAMYEEGRGTAKNDKQAFEWYLLALDKKKNPYAMLKLAAMYEEGRGTAKNDKQAFEWYLKVAETGNANAICKVASMYEEGIGVTGDYDKAMQYYQKAVNLGSSFAMFSIGKLYEHGRGIEQNYSKAMEWYLKATESNDENSSAISSAMFAIANLYRYGSGFEQDCDKAIEWYKKSADLGNPDSSLQMYALIIQKKLSNHQDFSEELKQYVTQIKTNYSVKNSNVYFSETDSKSALKKIKNAIKEYAPLQSGEAVIMGWDDTFFGSATDGFLLTTRGIYIHNSGESSKTFTSYDDIENIRCNEQVIYIGNKFIKFKLTPDLNSMKSLCKTLTLLKTSFGSMTSANQNVSTSEQNDSTSQDFVDIEKITMELAFKYEAHNLYFNEKANSKAQKKIRNAIGEYANLDYGEIPISCYDATFFGSAKDGCLFTTHGIHIHNSGDKNKPFIAYKDLKSVRYHDEKIYVNDEIIKIYMITDENKQKSVCEMIKELKSIFASAD